MTPFQIRYAEVWLQYMESRRLAEAIESERDKERRRNDVGDTDDEKEE